jgi:hypothetical protein
MQPAKTFYAACRVRRRLLRGIFGPTRNSTVPRPIRKDSKISNDWDGAMKELKKLRKKDVAVEKSGGIIPKHNRLIAKCQQEVITAYSK